MSRNGNTLIRPFRKHYGVDFSYIVGTVSPEGTSRNLSAATAKAY